MTKSKKLSTIFIAIFLIVLFTGCTKAKERKYSSSDDWGKDTVISFGDTDGRFAILDVTHSTDIPPILNLFDMKYDSSIAIEEYITNYKEITPYAYTIGKKGYTKLNYNDGKIIQSKNLKDFTDVDIKIFKKLKLKDLTK